MGERLEDSAAISLDIGSPGFSYIPGGSRQRWIVRNSDPLARVYGMQLSVRAASDPARTAAGDLSSIDATTTVICEDERFKGSSGCLPTAPVQFLHHVEPRIQGRFELDWTPPANDIGDLLVYVASNASVSGQRNSRIHFRTFRLSSAAGPRIVSAAGFHAAIGPASWISVLGSNLASTTRSWGAEDIRGGALPETLDGIGVRINGLPAYNAYVSPGQINALAPDDTSTGEVRVEVTRDGTSVSSFTTRLNRLAPAFFSTPATLVRSGQIISLYGTGFGPTNPPVPAGRDFSGAAPCVSPVAIRVGGVPAEVQFAGLIGPGLYQFNLVVPDLPAGEHAIEAEVENFKTPAGPSVLVTR